MNTTIRTLRNTNRDGSATQTVAGCHPIPIYHRETGEAQPASLFVAALGASSYTFAHATLSQDLSNWIECHVLAFEFFQGTSQLIVPDNPRTGVTRACRYEPDLNRTYLEMAQFYNVAIMPTRPTKLGTKIRLHTATVHVAKIRGHRCISEVVAVQGFDSEAEECRLWPTDL